MYKTGILIYKENNDILIKTYNDFEKKYEEKMYIDKEAKINNIKIGETFIFVSNTKNEILEIFKMKEIINNF